MQEVDELNEDLAAKIILQAREDWFKAGEIIIDEDNNKEELDVKAEIDSEEEVSVEELKN